METALNTPALPESYSEDELALISLCQKVSEMEGINPVFYVSQVVKRITSYKPITKEQVLAVITMANKYGIDPTSTDVFAFVVRGKNGRPDTFTMGLGISAWAKILDARHCSFRFEILQYSQFTNEAEETIVYPAVIKAVITRPDGSSGEWIVNYSEVAGGNPLYRSEPTQMMQVRALARCARVMCGLGSVYDVAEAKAFYESSWHVSKAETLAAKVKAPSLPQKQNTAVLPQSTVTDAETDTGELEAELQKLNGAKTLEEARAIFRDSPLRGNEAFRTAAVEATARFRDAEQRQPENVTAEN